MRRVETITSRTAEMTCLCRAASSLERRPLYKSDDWIARLLLPKKVQFAFMLPPARRALIGAFAPEGIYEWVIARTKYLDSFFVNSAGSGFGQVLLLGAGFDTRGIRFERELKEARVFELDAPTTQGAKIDQYHKRGVCPPSNLLFVPINFEKESVEQKLREIKFDAGCKSFVVAEGVTQYLEPQAIDELFRTIEEFTAPGSRIVFDYAHASVLKGESKAYGEERMQAGLNRSGESWQFGLDEGEVEPFLRKYGLRLLARMSPADLEAAYFTDASGARVARINGTQSIVLAERQTEMN